MKDIVCISHLRWNFVWQRPQHLLARFAKNQRVLFVEEPITNTSVNEPYLNIFPAAGCNNVTVIQLIQPTDQDFWIGHGDSLTQTQYAKLLQKYLKEHNYSDIILWLYTPMALDFVEVLKPSRLIYDVMDQLAAFKGAPSGLIEQEKNLLRQADIVFTGGPSLYRAKKEYNPNTFLFPSGVEIAHFAGAAQPHLLEKPLELQNLAKPILGYYGVIDERMDLNLLAYLADNEPDWQIVLIGPVIKIDFAELPQASNLHYFGKKEYGELPSYLAYFDVALIPFAINEATEFLSPTKTLEYLAARKPVVSTPIRDVIELYGEVVKIGHNPAEFRQQVKLALTEDSTALRDKEAALLKRYDWETIVCQMQEII